MLYTDYKQSIQDTTFRITRETATFGGVSFILICFFTPILTQMVLKLPQGHEGSEYVLGFEIGQEEGGFYSARLNRHTQ